MEPIMSFKSRILGRNADVRIYQNRIEWQRQGGYKLSRTLVGLCTIGISYCFKWGRERVLESTQMLPIRSIQSTESFRRGPVNTIVTLRGPAKTVTFTTGHERAAEAEVLIGRLILEPANA